MIIDLTRIALIEDCAALISSMDEMCEAFREAARERGEFMQFGPLRGADDGFALSILDRYRRDWEAHRTVRAEVDFRSAPLPTTTESESVLAFVLGWICHRAAERLLPAEGPEASLRRDAYLFRSRYVLPEAVVSRAGISELFEVLKQRYFIEMHTFKPDADDIEGWFDRLYAGMEAWDAQIERLAGAAAEPDPRQGGESGSGELFYRRDDPIIALAERLRNREAAPAGAIRKALEAEPQSRYGRALQSAVAGIGNANDFFLHRADEAALQSII